MSVSREHVDYFQREIDTAPNYVSRLGATVNTLLEAMGMPLDFVPNWVDMDEERLRNYHLSISALDVIAAVKWMIP